jgi:hypothetical protein
MWLRGATQSLTTAADPVVLHCTMQGQCIWVPNLSLVEMGGIRLLLMINFEAVRRVQKATARMAI